MIKTILTYLVQLITFYSSVFEQVVSERDDAGTTNDMITLTGLGKITHWHFPNINYCPHPNCQEDFENSSAAKIHYQEHHAMNAILCLVCLVPIYSYSIDGYIVHYRNAHPNEVIPFGFNDTSDNTANDQVSQQINQVRLN